MKFQSSVNQFTNKEPKRTFNKPSDNQSQISQSLAHLKQVLLQMDTKRNPEKPLPIIIIDNCNMLAEKQPSILESLQDTAKLWIDSQLALFIFVTSEGKTESIMNGNLIIIIYRKRSCIKNENN